MNYQSLAKENFGRNVTINGIQHTVSKLADNEGKLKNGDSVPYIIMTSATGEEVSLHPRKALQLFTKGEVDGIAMLVAAEAGEVLPAAKKAAKPDMDAFFNDPAFNGGEATPESVTSTETVPVAATEAPSIVKPLSKKQQAINIFNEAVALKETRQYVIKRMMAEVGLSLNGCNTYYQAIKSGAWV